MAQRKITSISETLWVGRVALYWVHTKIDARMVKQWTDVQLSVIPIIINYNKYCSQQPQSHIVTNHRQLQKWW